MYLRDDWCLFIYSLYRFLTQKISIFAKVMCQLHVLVLQQNNFSPINVKIKNLPIIPCALNIHNFIILWEKPFLNWLYIKIYKYTVVVSLWGTLYLIYILVCLYDIEHSFVFRKPTLTHYGNTKCCILADLIDDIMK